MSMIGNLKRMKTTLKTYPFRKSICRQFIPFGAFSCHFFQKSMLCLFKNKKNWTNTTRCSGMLPIPSKRQPPRRSSVDIHLLSRSVLNHEMAMSPEMKLEQNERKREKHTLNGETSVRRQRKT